MSKPGHVSKSIHFNWLTLAFLFIALFAIGYLILHLFVEESIKTRIGLLLDSTRPADDLYMVVSIFYSVATLFLTGVVLIAPILSLSLHQFHDSIFDLWLKSSEKKESNLTSVMENEIRKLFKIYENLNRLYYALWFSAITSLVLEIGLLIFSLWSRHVLFIEGFFFLILSLIISTAFSALAFYLFLKIRPGETKLRLFLKYIDVHNHPVPTV